MRTGISILYQVERIPNQRGNMGTGVKHLQRWLSPPFIKLWKQISIPLIIISDPDGSHMEYEWLMDKRHEAKKIKGKEKQHPFYNNFNPHNNTPLLRLFPNLFYQTIQWTPQLFELHLQHFLWLLFFSKFTSLFQSLWYWTAPDPKSRYYHAPPWRLQNLHRHDPTSGW